jgi:hypothetical protein
METAPAFVTCIAVVGVVLLMLLFVWHYLGPTTSAWMRANREEKIGLSKNKLFSPNGYLVRLVIWKSQVAGIQSGNNFLSLISDSLGIGNPVGLIG